MLFNILEDLKTQADIVLIDSVDLPSVVDTQLIAPPTDAVLLVVRSGSVSTQALRQSCRQLQQVEKPLFGSVLTGARGGYTADSRFQRYQHPPHLPPVKDTRQPAQPDASKDKDASSQSARAPRAPVSQHSSR
jgi:Mrp family chromosome partitioning ATPase